MPWAASFCSTVPAMSFPDVWMSRPMIALVESRPGGPCFAHRAGSCKTAEKCSILAVFFVVSRPASPSCDAIRAALYDRRIAFFEDTAWRAPPRSQVFAACRCCWRLPPARRWRSGTAARRRPRPTRHSWRTRRCMNSVWSNRAAAPPSTGCAGASCTISRAAPARATRPTSGRCPNSTAARARTP